MTRARTQSQRPRAAAAHMQARMQEETRPQLVLPHPADPSRSVAWTGRAFDLGGEQVRVLGYGVSSSGWTDDLTQLHEQCGGSDHFIDAASRAHALGEVMRCIGERPATVLEIGCSSGFLLQTLAACLPGHVIVGSDYTRGTLEAVGRRLPDVPLIQFDLTRCPLPGDFADIAILLNVLEHIGDHELAVSELHRIIRPGGAAIIEVPAGSSLFDIYDQVLMHQRRYDMRDLVGLLNRAGFIIERRSHLGFLLFPAFYLTKRFNQFRFGRRRDIDQKAVVARMIASTRKTSPLMARLMAFERALGAYVAFPFGVRCLVTCRKPPVS